MIAFQHVSARMRAVLGVCTLMAGSGACDRSAHQGETREMPEPFAPSAAKASAAGSPKDGVEHEFAEELTPATQASAPVTSPLPSPPRAAGRGAGAAFAPQRSEKGLTMGLFAGGSQGVMGHGSALGAAAPAATIALPNDVAPVPPPVAVTHLNPNARYATTYRPGGAAMAAFDEAVSRGQIPTSYKDLVGDFGARYTPALAAPADGALAISVDTERGAVAPGGGPMNLVVALASSDRMPSRAPLSVHIVLDVSGSMAGRAIEDAKNAAEATVRKLEPADDFSMVTFSNDAQILVNDGPIGPRRAQVLARIQDVQANGGTCISSGLDLGYAEARAHSVSDEAVRVVMLLSDGHANAGDTDPASLANRAARAFQDGIQTSAFGLGQDFDAGLMSGIADRGAGGYYYLADSSQIESVLAREIDARLRPAATAVEVRVRLRPDVSATRVFGSRELTAVESSSVRAQEVAVDRQESHRGIASDRESDAAGGMRFFIPAFARADRHSTIITLALPSGTGERSIASVEVRYKDRLLQKNVTRELPVRVRWAASDAESASTEDASLQRMAQAFAAGETILEAADRVDSGDRAGARQLLDERADVLQRASVALAEPRLAEDGARLQRLATAVGGDRPMSDALPLVVMLRGSGFGYL
jgi:Ca-activated chloride channel family protein